MQPKPNYKQLK